MIPHPPIENFNDVPIADIPTNTLLCNSTARNWWPIIIGLLNAANAQKLVCLPPPITWLGMPSLIAGQTRDPIPTAAPANIVPMPLRTTETTDVKKTELELNMENDINVTGAALYIYDPALEKRISVATSRKAYWYRFADTTVPPALRWLTVPCDKPFTLLPLSFRMIDPATGEPSIGHYNALLVDHRRKLVQRFEPHGSRFYGPEGTTDFIDTIAPIALARLFPGYRYEGPSSTCPTLGPQSMSAETEGIPGGEEGGYCVCWAFLFIILRMLNPNWTPEQITKQMNRIGSLNWPTSYPRMATHVLGHQLANLAPILPKTTHRNTMALYIRRFAKFVENINLNRFP